MNDLAEKALDGLGVARREICARPMLSFAVLGFAISCIVVGAGGQAGAARAARPISSWLRLQNRDGGRSDNVLAGSLMLAAIIALVLVWIAVVEFVRRSEPAARRVWWVAGAWAAPFALGPPLMDTSIQSYAAFGLLQRHGLDPYDADPNRLGADPLVAAIDPGSRGTPSGVGPLGTFLQHLAVSIASGSALGTLIVLRVVGLLAAVAIGRAAVELAGARRGRALSLTVLNPLLLLYIVSAGHFDGVMIALVLAAIAAANQRRWIPAIVLVCLAGSVTAQGFVVLPAIMAVHRLGRRRSATWVVLGRDALVAAATSLAVGFAVPGGFGWLTTVSKQFSAHPPFCIASGVAKLLSPIVRGASYDDLAAGARITTVTAMVCVIGYLIITARNRALERTAAYSLLAMALLAPVLFPWYLLWGTLCLAPTANGPRRVAVLALCAGGCALAPSGFPATAAHVVTGCLLAVGAVVTAAVLVRRQRAAATGEPVGAAG